jgi:hypothetical protein
VSRFHPVAWVAALCLSGTVACSASSSESGGEELFDAAVATADDGGVCSETVVDAGSGTGWSDLYRDYFGPTGKASCAGTGQCHGSTTQAGTVSSGYVCPDTADGCYAGITAASNIPVLVTVGDTGDPTTSGLYTILRKCAGGGLMPLQPSTLMFTNADMARIDAWLKAGAPND